MNKINYYKTNEILNHKYYQIPQELFINSFYKDKLNSDSKLLYGFLLDRLTLSQKHHWYDSDGNVYLIFTRLEIADKLGLSEKTVTKAFAQLSVAGLIEEKRRGLGKPNHIYVGKIQHEEITDTENLPPLNRKIYGSGTVENTVLEQENFPTINTNTINTDIDNLILSNLENEIDKGNSYESIFKQNIEYKILVADPNNAGLINNITDVAIDTLDTKKEFVYINSEPKPTEIVKSQLLKIKSRTYPICCKLLKR